MSALWLVYRIFYGRLCPVNPKLLECCASSCTLNFNAKRVKLPTSRDYVTNVLSVHEVPTLEKSASCIFTR